MNESSGRSPNGFSERSNSQEISRLLIEGKSSVAISELRAELAASPEDPVAKSELACALAFAGDAGEAARLLTTLGKSPGGTLVKSRVAAARALLASKSGDFGSIEGHLIEAYANDSSYPLLHLLMGRYFMLVNRDFDRAEIHLRRLVESVPDSVKASVHLATLLSESGKRDEGRRFAIQNAIAHPGSLTADLVAFFASLVALPMRGGVFLTALAILSFVPYLGPVVFVGWLTVAIAAFVTLRRIWPRVAFGSVFGLLALTVGYVARAIVWGRLYP